MRLRRSSWTLRIIAASAEVSSPWRSYVYVLRAFAGELPRLSTRPVQLVLSWSSWWSTREVQRPAHDPSERRRRSCCC